MNKLMEWWMPKWQAFEKKFPRLSKWVYQIAFFFLFSMGVTVFGVYLYAWNAGHRPCRHRIYVAAGSDEDFWRGVYLESSGI